jgi:hypothetical protein
MSGKSSGSSPLLTGEVRSGRDLKGASHNSTNASAKCRLTLNH